MTDSPRLAWTEAGAAREARWQSEARLAAPAQVQIIDDATPAAEAWRLAQAGVGLLWRGDWQNARNLLQAMSRRAERQQARPGKAAASALEAFRQHRARQATRAQALAMLLIEVAPGHQPLARRAQDLALAAQEAWGDSDEAYVAPLRDLLAAVSAHEWRKKGVAVAALDARIHAHYGVFSPLRGEYLDLVAQAPLPGRNLAFDIGCGSGVIAAILARRGMQRVIATDLSPRALACTHANISALGYAEQISVEAADLFPAEAARAALIVCNPPWLPETPTSAIETAVFDPDSRMLRGFLAGVGERLTPQGEAWLIISDIAELLGLRSREALLDWITAGGMEVVARHDTRPRHAKAHDREDPLFEVRSREITSLWRLRARPAA